MLPFLAASLLVMAQQGATSAPPTLEDDRLRACMTEARSDPAQAIATASQWLEGLPAAATSAPQQCLGFAYMGLLRWDAAMVAFATARDARPEGDLAGRARLGAMAGNAALAAGQFLVAEGVLSLAAEQALAGGDAGLAGQAQADQARALVALNDMPAAAAALEQARAHAPQDAAIWLLSATLARRTEDMANARAFIATAGLIAPRDAAIGLEAGLIAAMTGDDPAARASWQAVIDLDSASPEAATARRYLLQLAEAPPPQ
jgi:tetratricopeptide (TPR) repeat protein